MTSKASSKDEKKKKKEKAGGQLTQEKNDPRKKPADEEKNAKRVDTEVTQMCCVFDPQDTEGLKMPYFISVGWDKKIHVWADEKDEVVASTKILPQNDQTGHKDDIMSAVFCNSNNLIYTGGHDGTLIAWNFETGYSKHYLHEKDETCTSKDYIKEGKSVDQLVILEERKKLLSMSADQYLRFWNLDDLTSDKQPSFKFYCDHPKDDGLSAVAVDKTNNILLTGDTSGQMKMWDISQVDLNNEATKNRFIEKYFIIAHRSTINSIQIVDEKTIKSGRFIISAGNDNNINLHQLETGIQIGQFGQAKPWNIHDISAFEKKKPRYVREWYLLLKQRFKRIQEHRIPLDRDGNELPISAMETPAIRSAGDSPRSLQKT